MANYLTHFDSNHTARLSILHAADARNRNMEMGGVAIRFKADIGCDEVVMSFR